MENSIRTRRRINNTRKNAVAINGDDKPRNNMTGRNARNHFTRSRNPKSSSPRKINKRQQESVSIFVLHRISHDP